LLFDAFDKELKLIDKLVDLLEELIPSYLKEELETIKTEIQV
jgi:hypothetical protein